MNSLRKNWFTTHGISMVVTTLALWGCGSPVNIGSDKCDINSCSGLAKPVPAQCADGSTTAATGACIKTADGSCAWEVTTCASTCTPGATKRADDGCNQCTCTQDGQWGCTLLGCDTGCVYQGVHYGDGAQFTTTEGCCQCSSGAVKCLTDLAMCSGSCLHDGKIYNDGATIPSIDGCNTCACYKGQIACTTMACVDPSACVESDCGAKPHSLPYACSDGSTGGFTGQCLRDASGVCSWEIRECPADPGACTYEGATRTNGSVFAGGGGCCACIDGIVTCELTAAYCGNACIYNGKVHTEGETYPSTSSCNTCTCKAGESICTRNACPDPAACTPEECGGKPDCSTITCNDGSIAGCLNNCYRDASGKCTWEVRMCPTECKPGDEKHSANWCETCTCTSGGTWSCTTVLDATDCTPWCTDDGVTYYPNGTQFSSSSGCCQCIDGKAMCDASAGSCTSTCVYAGKTYPSGARYPAENSSCNTCTCTNGESICTQNPCPITSIPCSQSECKDPKPTGIVYQCTDGSLAGPVGDCVRDATGVCGWKERTCETKCSAGDETLSADGCSKCICDSTGTFVCTQGQCPTCAAGDPGFFTGQCAACTIAADLTCNDDPTVTVPTGSCVRNTCSCNQGYGLNPANGKCTNITATANSACSPNSGPSCNGNLEVSSIQGVCLYDGTCLCTGKNVLDPTTGRCVIPR